ncbi:MAG: hypothetical protein ACAH88_04000, partial [Roseimicrobium sp.]
HEDIVKALRDLDSFVDVTETDLIALSRKIAREREARILKQRRKEKDQVSHQALTSVTPR